MGETFSMGTYARCVRFLMNVDDQDLALLREHFDGRPGGGVQFGTDDAWGPFMELEVDADPNAISRQATASTVLTRTWGLLQLLEEPQGRAELTGTHIDAQGKPYQVVSPRSIASREAVGRPTIWIDGVPVEAPPPSRALDLLALAESRPVVGEVFDLLGKSQLNWIDLYKVFEIVREEGGGVQGVEEMGWATRRKQSAFTASANRKDVSGDEARHARSTGLGKPREVMTIHEARVFIRGLAVDWLRHLSASEDFAD